MPTVDREVTTRTDPQRVWEFLSDFTTTEQWDPPTVRTVRTTGHGGVGTVYENTSRILGRDTDITYTVVESEPPRLLRLRGRSSSMTALDTIEVSPVEGGGTRVHYTAEFSLQGAAKLVEPLMPLGLKKLGDDAAASLQVHLDALHGA